MDRRTAARHTLTGLAGALAGGLAAVMFAQAAPVEAEALAPPRPAAERAPQPAPEAPAPLYAFEDPVAGYEVVSPFGPRRLPWEEHGRLHAGVDVAAPPGYPVQAAADGVVLRAGTDEGYGRFVDVRHVGGLTTRYAHLGAIMGDVRPGLMVRRGDQIGRVGNSGSSTGAHLHFEIRDDRGRPLNPELLLGRTFADADDLPLAAAARVPRGMRVAHVSYIPRKKRELMEAREAEREAAAQGEAQAPVSLATPSQTLRLTRGPDPETITPAARKPLVLKVPPADLDAPIVTAPKDPFAAGEYLRRAPTGGG